MLIKIEAENSAASHCYLVLGSEGISHPCKMEFYWFQITTLFAGIHGILN